MTTAYCFDPEHVYHREAGHPERPDRLAAVMTRLRDTGLLDTLQRVPVDAAPLEAILRLHPEEYVVMLESACVRGGLRLDVDTYATEASFRIARRGVGGLLEVVDTVLEGRADNGFALIRPPGHHARPFSAMGFCLFGNVAIAARHAQKKHGVGRVMIVDFDVHHGNGTQEMFYGDPDVLVVSAHQHPCYPGTGMLEEIGEGKGEGATLNLPYPPGTCGEALLAALREILPPLAARFRPDLVLVSAGYDAHHLDPLASAALSASTYAEVMRLLLEIADRHAARRLVASLEGGYHVAALAESVRCSIEVMIDPGAEIDDELGPVEAAGPDIAELTAEVRKLHGL